MPTALELPESLRAHLERNVEPYARRLVEGSALYALRLHAEEVGPEHLLCALMEDEDCAAHRAVLHAFADPETLADEARSLAAGIMVTGSAASLPFSEGGVRALSSARHAAAELGAALVEPAHVLRAAVEALEPDLHARFEEAGFAPERLAPAAGSGPAASPLSEEGALFRRFSEVAKRVLSQSAREARQAGDRAIGPAHLALACLAGEPALEGTGGVSASRARLLLRGRTADPTPLAARALPADGAYLAYLAEVPEATSSAILLLCFHSGRTPEIAQLLMRHKVTPALLERAREAFLDPEA